MQKYKTITATPDRFDMIVNDAVCDGWKPLGGVVVVFIPPDTNHIEGLYYVQALVKKAINHE